MTKLNESSLEQLLQKMVDAGVDMSEYRRSPTTLLVPPMMLRAAQQMFDEEDKCIQEVDFGKD